MKGWRFERDGGMRGGGVEEEDQRGAAFQSAAGGQSGLDRTEQNICLLQIQFPCLFTFNRENGENGDHIDK